MKLLVTGAAGFIGSTYVRLVAGEHGDEQSVIDPHRRTICKARFGAAEEAQVHPLLLAKKVEQPVKARLALPGLRG